MVMLVIDESRKEELEVLLEEAGIAGFTELSRAAGRGTTGPRLGSRAFPRTSAVVFSILADGELDALAERIRKFCADCKERLKMVAWEVEELL